MPRKQLSRYVKELIEWLFPLLLLLPVLILVIFFTVFPFGYAIRTSFFQILLVLPIEPFVGLKNYLDVLSSPYFLEALLNTLRFTFMTAPVIVIISLGVARLLLTTFFGRGVLRPLVLLPWAIPGSVAGILWLWIFQGQWGVLNGILMKLGLIENYIQWLTEPHLARFCVIVAHIWTQVPFASVLLMAALTTIPKEIYEASEVDRNWNGIPDECECICDVNGDEVVNKVDIALILSAWGPCDQCPEDVNFDGIVDIDDVFAILVAWGPCP